MTAEGSNCGRGVREVAAVTRIFVRAATLQGLCWSATLGMARSRSMVSLTVCAGRLFSCVIQEQPFLTMRVYIASARNTHGTYVSRDAGGCSRQVAELLLFATVLIALWIALSGTSWKS